jgi:signal-transduction protein with cAMP-binding, CBS, and nucleotidyltransferase domain
MSTMHDLLEVKGSRVHTTAPNATIHQAVDEMCRLRVGALIVTEKAAPIGIISERDIMARVILERLDPAKTKVADAMTRDVVCIDMDRPIEEAMAVMTQRRCRHLPVVLDGKVVGLVSIGDLVRWASRNQEYEIRMLQDYLLGKYPG